MKSRFFDKLIERVDRVGSSEVQTFLNRLAEESDFFKNVFDALQEGIIVADKSGLIHYINNGKAKEELTFEQYLKNWLDESPKKHHIFIHSIARKLGISL